MKNVQYIVIEILFFLVLGVDWSKVDTAVEMSVAWGVVVLLLAALAGIDAWSGYRKNAQL